MFFSISCSRFNRSMFYMFSILGFFFKSQPQPLHEKFGGFQKMFMLGDSKVFNSTGRVTQCEIYLKS